MADKDLMRRVGNNIYQLRTFIGESSEDLAFSLGLNGKSAIGNYESGKRLPKPEILEKIAMHYGITRESLLNEDFTSMSNTKFPDLEDTDTYKTIWKATLKIFVSDEALNNKNFKAAYIDHIKLQNDILNQRDLASDYDIEVIINRYEKAWKKGIIEAAANLLWIYFFIANIVFFEPGLKKAKEYKVGKATQAEVLQTIISNSDDNDTLQEKEDVEETIKELELEMIPLIISLKQTSVEWAEYAEYFIALKYMYGLVYNDESLASNRHIGNEMMMSLDVYANRYATMYRDTLVKIK